MLKTVGVEGTQADQLYCGFGHFGNIYIFCTHLYLHICIGRAVMNRIHIIIPAAYRESVSQQMLSQA